MPIQPALASRKHIGEPNHYFPFALVKFSLIRRNVWSEGKVCVKSTWMDEDGMLLSLGSTRVSQAQDSIWTEQSTNCRMTTFRECTEILRWAFLEQSLFYHLEHPFVIKRISKSVIYHHHRCNPYSNYCHLGLVEVPWHSTMISVQTVANMPYKRRSSSSSLSPSTYLRYNYPHNYNDQPKQIENHT